MTALKLGAIEISALEVCHSRFPVADSITKLARYSLVLEG